MKEDGKKRKVIIVAPGRKSEGGIRTVISSIYAILSENSEFDIYWLETHRSGSLFGKLTCLFSAMLKSVVLFPRASMIHVHASIGRSLLRKSFFIWFALFCRCRVILHFHATKVVFERFFQEGGLIAAYSAEVMRRCDRIVVLSEIWEDVVGKVVPDSNIEVIYNPVPRVHGVERGKEAETPSVLYLAHLVKRKGYHDLIEAFSDVTDRWPSAKLILCGSGEINSARELCESFGITENVEFEGWVSSDEKGRVFSKAMIFCLPSYDEGLPMSILEAMSCRIPIIATPVGGIPDVLKDGENALLFEPGNSQQLAEKISILFANSELRSRLATAALEKSRNFEVTEIANQWLNLYRSIDTRN